MGGWDHFRDLLRRFYFWCRYPQRKSAPRSKKVGDWGESLAADYLHRKGFKIIGRNVRPNRHDELDLIVLKDRLLVFVEVKTRKSEAWARPASAVNARKRHALRRAALSYLSQAKHPALNYRFDIIEVIGQPEDPTPPIIRQIENAMPPKGR